MDKIASQRLAERSSARFPAFNYYLAYFSLLAFSFNTEEITNDFSCRYKFFPLNERSD